jgi:phenylacetate-CoA ligase
LETTMHSALTTSASYECATLDRAILKQRTEEFAAHLWWSRARILEHRQTSLRQILRHAASKSPYFRDAIGKLVETDAPLEAYPTMSKSILMAEFDRIVTDPRLTRTMLEDHAESRNCGELLLDEYRVVATGGSSGQRGLFVYDRDSWEIVNGALRRWHQTSGAPPSPRVVGIGAPSPVHLSNRFSAEIRAINTEAPRLSPSAYSCSARDDML